MTDESAMQRGGSVVAREILRVIASTGRAGYPLAMLRRTQTALLILLSPALATEGAAQLVRGQIRTIELPPSQPEPAPQVAVPEPAADAPQVEPSGGLALDLPTVDEARAIDADREAATTDASGASVDADAAAQAIIAAEAIKLRAANTEQLAVARRQLDQIEADKRAERDRVARYQEARAAHAAAMADYNAQLEAARAARERWEADVAACQAGDRSRCGALPAPQ